MLAAPPKTRQALAHEFGREVYFSWEDEDELVVVDTEEEWEDLVAELTEDWREENEYNGVMDVKLVEAAMADKTVTGHRRAGDRGHGSLNVADPEPAQQSCEEETEEKGLATVCPPARDAAPFDSLSVLRHGRLELEESRGVKTVSEAPIRLLEAQQALGAEAVDVDVNLSAVDEK